MEDQRKKEQYEDIGVKKSTSTRAFLYLLATLAIATIIGVTAYFLVRKPETEKLVERVSAYGIYRKAAVASDNAQCSEIGRDILYRHGSAIDATIATLLLGDSQYALDGIGGGFFMTSYTRSTGVVKIYDARERAPRAATQSMFVNDTEKSSLYGGLAIGVPGEIKGYWAAHNESGHLPWKTLFEPAIRMCREGFQITYQLAKAIRTKSKRCWIEQYHLKERFYDNCTNTWKKEGDTLRLPHLAETLERIAENGVSEFYEGDTAQAFIKDIQAAGSIITLEDLKNYTVEVKDPVTLLLDDMKLYSAPPPASGAVLGLILNILDNYNLTADDLSTTQKRILTYHRIVESFKFAYAKRSLLGDEDFVDMGQMVSNMTSESYARSLYERISDNQTHDWEYYDPVYDTSKESHGTSHLSVLAENGDAVAVTSTINTYFGSCVRSSSTGILFNNEMDDFSTPGHVNFFGIPASPSNYIVPGKRPMSSMCPTIVVDAEKDVRLVVGASGGSRITTAAAWVTVHSLWLDETINKAIDAWRLHHQLIPTHTEYEKGFPQDLLSGLKQLNHKVVEAQPEILSVSQGIQRLKAYNVIYAASDWRKNGSPAGY